MIETNVIVIHAQTIGDSVSYGSARLAALRYMLELGPFGPRAEPPKKPTPKTANDPQKIPLSVRKKQLRMILANHKRGK